MKARLRIVWNLKVGRTEQPVVHLPFGVESDIPDHLGELGRSLDGEDLTGIARIRGDGEELRRGR